MKSSVSLWRLSHVPRKREPRRCKFLPAVWAGYSLTAGCRRVAEIEERLDTIMDMIKSGKIAIPNASQEVPYASPAETIVLPFIAETGSDSWPEAVNAVGAIPKIFQSEALSAFDLYAPKDRLKDAISKGIIDYQDAKERIRDFRSKTRRCPFVVIPANMSLETLRRERPFLLLAILAFTTDHNARLQNRLKLELREVLSRRMVVDGEKSLDLLQGLMVYITWYVCE